MSTSKTVLIFGASGKTGQALLKHLRSDASESKHSVVGVVRNFDKKSSIELLGAQAITHDIGAASVQDLTEVISKSKADVIVWVAGAAPPNTEDAERIDHQAAVRTFEAAEAAGASRLISISALDCRDRSKEAPEWYSDQDKAGSDRLWKVLEPYMEAKLKSDAALVKMDKLKWTIIRPGRLTEDEPTGKVDAGRVHFARAVTRADVAAVVVQCIENDGTAGLAFDVVGGNVDVQEAIKKVADQRLDCFQGYF